MNCSAAEKGTGHWVVVFLAYCAITLSFFWPTLPHLNEALIGPPEDNQQFFWTFRHMRQALFDPQISFLYSNSIYYPEGQSLVWHTVSWFNAALSIPMQEWFGLPLTYNLLMLSTFVFSAMAAYLLCLDMTKYRLAAFVGGFIYGFCPRHFAHALHHLNCASMQFIPLFVLFYMRAVASRTAPARDGVHWWRDRCRLNPVLATLCLVLASMCSWYWLQILCIFVAVECLVRLLLVRRLEWKRYLCAAKIFVAAIVLLLPLLVPMLEEVALEPDRMKSNPKEWMFYSVDLLGFVTPQHSVLAGAPIYPEAHVGEVRAATPELAQIDQRGNPWEKEGFLGYTNLFLVLLVALWFPRRHRASLLIILVFAVLAMGSHPVVNGYPLTCISLPYRWLALIPGAGVGSSSGLLVVIVYLFVAVIVAHGLKMIRDRVNKRFIRFRPAGSAAVMGVGILVFTEFYSVAGEMTPCRLPPTYNLMRPEHQGAVADFPLNHWRTQECSMLFQTLHGREIIGGVVSRQLSVTLRNKLSTLRPEQMSRLLKKNGVRYVVVHKTQYKEAQLKKVKSDLSRVFKVLGESRQLILFDVMAVSAMHGSVARGRGGKP